MRSTFRDALLGLAGTGLIVGLWAFFAAGQPELLLPSPAQTADALWRLVERGTLWPSLGTTLGRALTGLAGAVAAGVVWGVAAGTTPSTRAFLSPLRIGLLGVPPIAMVTVVSIWLGSIGEVAILVVVLIFTPALAHATAEGVRAIDSRWLEMARAFDVGWRRRISGIVLPAVASPLIAAATVAAAAAFRVMVMAEFLVAPDGVGSEISTARTNLDIAEVFAWCVVAVAVAVALELGYCGRRVDARCGGPLPGQCRRRRGDAAGARSEGTARRGEPRTVSAPEPADRAARRSGPHAWTHVADEITRMIVNGELAPGQRISEPALARQLGVSRLPVREAIRALDRSGLIEVTPNRGARVRETSATQAGHLLALRALVEGFAAAEAAVHRTAAQLAGMRALLDAGSEATVSGDHIRAMQTHDDLMRAIESAAANPYLSELTEPLRLRVQPQLARLLPRRGHDPWLEHARVVDAIADRDPDRARAAIADHLAAVRAAREGLGE